MGALNNSRMPVGQIINLALIIGVAAFAWVIEDGTNRVGSLKGVILGALLILAQLASYKLFHFELIALDPLKISDILLVKQFRSQTGLVVVGYIFILCGLIGLLKSYFIGETSLTDGDQEKNNPSEKK